jgi:hypothetical protein
MVPEFFRSSGTEVNIITFNDLIHLTSEHPCIFLSDITRKLQPYDSFGHMYRVHDQPPTFLVVTARLFWFTQKKIP